VTASALIYPSRLLLVSTTLRNVSLPPQLCSDSWSSTFMLPETHLSLPLPQVASLDLAQVVGGIARNHRPRVRVMHVPRKSRSYSDSSLSQLSVGLLDRARLNRARRLPSSRHRCRRSAPLSERLSGRAAQRARPWCRRPPGSANSVRQETPTTPARCIG
jgi:hypothetical protein